MEQNRGHNAGRSRKPARLVHSLNLSWKIPATMDQYDGWHSLVQCAMHGGKRHSHANADDGEPVDVEVLFSM